MALVVRLTDRASLGDPVAPGVDQGLAEERDEECVRRQIAAPHLPRLHHQPPEPLESHTLHAQRRAANLADEYIEAAADTHDDGHTEGVAVFFAPRFFEG